MLRITFSNLTACCYYWELDLVRSSPPPTSGLTRAPTAAMNVVSPSEWENIPAELLSTVRMHVEPDSPIDTTRTTSIANTNSAIPMDDISYADEFSVVDNDLYNDRSLASSVVKVVSKDPHEPPHIILGHELPVQASTIPFDWTSILADYPDTQAEEPCEPDLTKELNPCSFMIVPPINSLVEFTRALTLGDDSPILNTLGGFTGRSKDTSVDSPLNCFAAEKKPAPNVPSSPGFKTSYEFAAVASDPIMFTKYPHPRRFWRRSRRVQDVSTDPYVAYRGFRGYVRRIFKKHHGIRNHARTAALKQWAHTRNLIFWEHAHQLQLTEATGPSGSVSNPQTSLKELSTS